jgi:hypothetical protein
MAPTARQSTDEHGSPTLESLPTYPLFAVRHASSMFAASSRT